MDNVFHIPMIAIDSVVEPAHFFCSNLAAKRAEDFPQGRMPFESATIHDRNSFIRWEIAFVVFENDKSPGRNNAVGRAARHNVDLLVLESTIEKAEIHQERCSREL